MTKAVSLLSGGLDSMLATKLILEQGVEVEALYLSTVFSSPSSSKLASDRLGIKLKVIEVSRELFEIVKKPRYGYGRNINPCIDCKVFMFKKAGEYMRETGASFLISGEVLGERPMSQRKDAMWIIERDSGLKGLILRPLSAKLLEPTVPEKNGWVDRNKLLDINGRSRKVQIQLARKFGISEYPNPSGGCLLTDPGFARRMKDLIEHKEDFTMDDVQLLKIGRHFRLAPKAKLIVGRDQQENQRLLDLAKDGDLRFYPARVKGPIGIGRGVFNQDDLYTASSLIARYCDGFLNQQYKISYKQIPDQKLDTIFASPIEEFSLQNLRL